MTCSVRTVYTVCKVRTVNTVRTSTVTKLTVIKIQVSLLALIHIQILCSM